MFTFQVTWFSRVFPAILKFWVPNFSQRKLAYASFFLWVGIIRLWSCDSWLCWLLGNGKYRIL